MTTFVLTAPRCIWCHSRVCLPSRMDNLALGLNPSERLEIEGGEDIDLISECKLTGNEQRLLEQIKNLTGTITLWSSIGPIANFEHRQRNPGSALRFLFTTTASITIERPSPQILQRQPGILVWEGLRQNPTRHSSGWMHWMVCVEFLTKILALKRFLSQHGISFASSSPQQAILIYYLIQNFQWARLLKYKLSIQQLQVFCYSVSTQRT